MTNQPFKQVDLTEECGGEHTFYKMWVPYQEGSAKAVAYFFDSDEFVAAIPHSHISQMIRSLGTWNQITNYLCQLTFPSPQ